MKNPHRFDSTNDYVLRSHITLCSSNKNFNVYLFLIQVLCLYQISWDDSFGLQANSLFPYTFKSFTSVPSQFLTQNYQLFCFIFKVIFYIPLKIFYCRKYNNSRLTTWLSTIRQLLQQDFCSFAGIAFTFTFRFSSQSKKYQFIQKLHI